MNNKFHPCDEIRNQLLVLSAADSMADGIKAHLDQCAACSSLYQDILTINQAVHSLPEQDVSDVVFEQTLAAVQAEKTTHKSHYKGINPQWATGLAASFVLVAVAGLIYNGSMSEFQVDFEQVPFAEKSVPIDKNSVEDGDLRWRQSTDKEQRSNQQVKKDNNNKPMSLNQSLQVVAAPKPSVSDTLNEIIAEKPAALNAPITEQQGFENEPFNDAKSVADRVMQDDKKDNMVEQDYFRADSGSMAVTGSRIKRPEPKDSEPMSLDQLLQTVQKSASEGSVENLKREAEFEAQRIEVAKEKVNRTEIPAEVNSKGDLTEAKQRDLKPKPAIQPRRDGVNDGFVASVEESEAVDFDDNLGGLFGRSLAGAGAAIGAEDAAIKYLAELQITENLAFKPATGYWANTYVPGDSNMRWIQAQLKQDNGLDLPAVHQNVQPFDYPSNAALGLFLNSDHKTLNETGPTRMRLQVGIQAGQQKGGHRSALNLAVVLDLGQQQRADLKAESKALLSALLKAKQPSDQISVYLVGPGGGQLVSAENFRHGSIQVALDKIFNHESASTATEYDLHQTLIVANGWLKAQDDPNAVLGSSAVLLVSANSDFTATTSIESLVQQNAIDGVTLSTVSLAGIEHRTQLQRLALMGQGHSRVLAGVQDAERLINEELLVSSRAVARALRLQIKLADGVQLIDVLDSYSLTEAQAQKVRDAEQSLDQRMSKNLGITADRGQDDDGIQMVIPSYFAGDTHVILLDVLVQNPGPVAEVTAKYKDLIYLRNATSQRSLNLSSGQNNLGPLELNVMKNMLVQRLSQTVNQASQALRAKDQASAVVKLNGILELYQAMRQHIPAWKSDAEMIQDETIIKQYLQLLNSQSSIDPKRYQLIADSLSFMSWRKLISHSP